MAAAGVVAATAIRLVLNPVLGTQSPYLPFVLAIMLAARFGGRVPGLAATVLSALSVAWFFVSPSASFTVPNANVLWGLALFVVTGSWISLSVGALRSVFHETVQAQQEARLANEQRNLALESAAMGTWSLDVQTGRVDWDERCQTLLGVPVLASGTYAQAIDRLHPDDRRRVDEAVQKALAPASSGEFSVEARTVWPDGSVHHLLSTGLVRFEGAGPALHAVSMAGTIQDITRRKRDEDRLRESEARLRLAVTASNIGLWDWDLATNAIYYSPEWKGQIGYADDEIPNHFDEWQNRVHPDDLEPTLRKVRSFLDNPQGRHEVEFRFRHKDRSYRWIYAQADVLRDVFGKPVRMLGCHVDITRRVIQQNALVESEEQFRTLANAIPQLCWMAHSDGWIFWYNQRWYAYTGTTPEQMFGWRWQSVHDPNTLPAVLERWRNSIATGDPFNMVFPLRGADGVLRPFLTRVMPVRDLAGRVVRWFGTNTDISEQQRTEAALRQSEERFRALVTASSDAIYRMNADWTRMCLLDGRNSIQDVASPRLDWLRTYIHPDDWPRVTALIQDAIRTKCVFELEHRVLRPDGTVGWTFSRMIPLLDAGGEIVEWFGAATDITRRRQAEEEIRRLNADLEQRVRERTAQLEAANQEMEAFAYSVSHDLRAPLRGIDGWSLALQEDYSGQLDERAQKYLARVRSEARRMGILIDDLLQLSRITRTQMESRLIDLSSAVDQVAARLREAYPHRRMEFLIERNLTAAGDPHLLDVALTNLLENAAKFTSPCHEARIQFGEAQAAGARAFYVRDNGVGFDMAFAGMLFGAFQRLHKSSEFPGTGIGLATVQRIIHRHGGRVWAESQPGLGATFYFTLGGS